MNNRDKEIRKLMAEKGFNSFDDLPERLNQFPTTDSYEDVVAELAELKMQLINPQPLFTLTAEEVETARKLINKGMDKLGHEIKQNRIKPSGNSWINNFDKKEPLFREGKNLLTRIKQWQDEQENNNNS